MSFGESRRAAAAAAAAAAVLIAATAGCGGSSGGGGGGVEPADRAGATLAAGKPNVVVIMTDDQTVEDLAQMPRTRRLIAAKGVSFDNYLVSFPLCCPSRATYLTGQYAHNSGVISNNPDFGGGFPALDSRRALPVWLDDAGYRTASIGRYLNFYGVVDPEQVPPGWNDWVAPPGPSTYLMYDYTLNEDGRLVDYGDAPSDYQTDVLARKAVDFIAERAPKPRPFFLSITPLAPHDENDETVPSRFEGPRSAPRHAEALDGLRLEPKPNRDAGPVENGSYRRRGRSLIAVDELVDGVVAALRDAGELDRTYVLFTSDNGYLLGEHDLKGKITPYDETVRVPLLARGPGIEPGTTIDALAANIDLAPTIARIASAEPAVEVDGVSLLGAMRGSRELPPRDILLENLDRARVPKQPLYDGIRNRRWSYVEFDNGERQLYDMRADPFQLRNLAGRSSERGAERRLSRRLGQLRECAGESCRAAGRSGP